MATSKVIYNGQLRTTCTHLQSGNSTITDAPIDNNGKGEQFSPTDLLATSLAACMVTIMGIVAEKNSISFEYCEAEVTKIMASNPRRVSEIQINLTLNNCLPDEKKMLETAALNCPVAKSISNDINQNITFIYR